MPTLALAGDAHRFQQTVQRLGPSDGPFVFSKPRSVLLEYLFTDSRSPYLDSLHLVLGRAPVGRVDELGLWNGQALDLSPHCALAPDRAFESASYAESCGRWLALATILGLTDLHSENTLVLADRESGGVAEEFYLQPIDLECAFWSCISGMDTFLIPSRLATPKQSGWMAQIGHEDLKFAHPHLALNGFFAAWRSLESIAPDWLRDLDLRLKGIPLRVLLRPTRVYRSLLTQPQARERDELLSRHGGPLLESELLQLQAGDIPYFFVERGTADPGALKFFKAPSQIASAEPKHFAATVVSATPSIPDFVSASRISNLCKITALHMIRVLEESWPSGDRLEQGNRIQGDGWTLTLPPGDRPGQVFALECSEFAASATFAKLGG